MKKLLIVLLSTLSIVTFAQVEVKNVAVLEPIGKTDEVTIMHRSMVRGEMIKAISNQIGYRAFERNEVDQILREQNFQQSGIVDDATRKRIGAMQGVDFICITKITIEGKNYYLEANLVNIETANIPDAASQYGELKDGNLDNMYAACEKLAAELVGKKTDVATHYSTQVPTYNVPDETTKYYPIAKNQIPPQYSVTQWVHYDGEYIIKYLIEKDYNNVEVNEQVLQQITGKIQMILQQVGRELKVKYIFDKKHLLYVDDNAVDVTDIIKDRL